MRISDWSSDVCSSDLFRYAVDRDPHRHALGKAHPAERRLHIGEQRARSGGPFTVADGRRHPDDMTFEHAVLAHQPDRRMLALLVVAELGFFEIAGPIQAVAVDQRHHRLPGIGIDSPTELNIGHDAVDRRSNFRALKLDPRKIAVGYGLRSSGARLFRRRPAGVAILVRHKALERCIRTEDRRVGEASARPCRTRWTPTHYKK